MNNFDLRKFLTENKLTSNSRAVENEDELNETPGITLYFPGEIAPADLYYSDKHGKLVALDDVDDKYHDRIKDWLVVRKGDKIEGPED
jgi:hypothetical protein